MGLVRVRVRVRVGVRVRVRVRVSVKARFRVRARARANGVGATEAEQLWRAREQRGQLGARHARLVGPPREAHAEHAQWRVEQRGRTEHERCE